MSVAKDTLTYLYGLQRFGIKIGLQNIRALCRYLGNPERKFLSVHVAGTNGKGSTSSMIASVLTASGYRTGLYTSPHLVNFSERIRIDGIKILEDEIIRYTRQLKNEIDRLNATFFEATTAIAFQYFADSKIDIAVIEAGLGGRWDATNVVTPLVSVITNIGLEHTQYLGKTYNRIAFEKGGIIKRLVPCITGATSRRGLSVLRNLSHKRKVQLVVIDEVSTAEIIENSLNGLVVDLQTRGDTYSKLFVALAGEHQLRNLRLAILVLEHLKRNAGFSLIAEHTIRDGLATVREKTGLRGRFDMLSQSPMIVADVAHNPDGIKALVNASEKLLQDKVVAVFGVMEDKAYREMIPVITRIARTAIAVQPALERSLPSSAIADEFHAYSATALDGGSVADGLRIALSERRTGESILVTGSHFVVGEALKFLNLIP